MGHTSDTLCYCADAYIINRGELLLHLHQLYNLWLAPGGHIDPGENPYQAALREAHEETGLILLEDQSYEFLGENYFNVPLPFATNQHDVGEGRMHISFAYAFSSKNREIKPGESEQETEFKWFSPQELESSQLNIPKNVRLSGVKAIELMKKT